MGELRKFVIGRCLYPVKPCMGSMEAVDEESSITHLEMNSLSSVVPYTMWRLRSSQKIQVKAQPAILESTIRSCQRQRFQRNTLYEREHAHNAELPAAKLENYG